MNEREVREEIERIRRKVPPPQPGVDVSTQMLVVLLGIFDAVDRLPADMGT